MLGILGELVTVWKIEVDDPGLKSAMGKVSELGKMAASLGTVAAGAAAAIFGLVKSTANAGEEAKNTAQKFGITTDAFQELMYAARGEAQFLQQGFLFLNKSIEDAGKGTKGTVETFKALHVAFKNADGSLRNTDDVLMDMTDSFSKMPDGAKKTALAVDVFGKSGANLIPFLNQGRDGISQLREEAQRLGVVMDSNTIEASDRFNDSLDDVMNILGGIKNMIGAEFMPVVQEILVEFKAWISANRDLIKQNISGAIKGLVAIIKVAWKMFEYLANVVVKVTDVFGGLGNVMKFVGTLMGLYAAGKIITGFLTLIRVIRSVQMAVLAFQAGLMIGPILIGLLAAALVLIFEDIYTFFQGGESYTGDFIKGLKSLWDTINQGYASIGGLGRIIIDSLLQPMRMAVGTVKSFIELYNMATGKTGAKEGFANIWGNIKNVASQGAGAGSLSESLGFGPSSAPVDNSNKYTASNNQTNRVVINQNINAGEGSSALETGKKVGASTEMAIDSTLRRAGLNFSSQGEY